MSIETEVMTDAVSGIALPRKGIRDIALVCILGGDKTLNLNVGGKSFLFDWSDRFGPNFVTKTGREKKAPAERHPFWRCLQLWIIQGKRVDGNTCLWEEPPAPPKERWIRIGRSRNLVTPEMFDRLVESKKMRASDGTEMWIDACPPFLGLSLDSLSDDDSRP